MRILAGVSDPYDDRTRELPAYLDPRGPGGGGIARGYPTSQSRPDMPPPGGPGGPRGPYGPGVTPPPPRRKRRGLKIALSIIAVLLVAIVGFGAYLDFNLKRQDVLADYAGRPPASAGTNWLMIGSDSRSDLTAEQKKQLATGSAEGSRTDTIMLLHIPDSGVPPTLVSLPRDTLVDVPGHGQQKLNAAFSIGGPKLLIQTVEKLTNLRMDHYAEIGFAGFAGVVDAVGGVNICVEQPIDDPKAGLKLAAGCQNLDGAQALGYVRTRATPRADLDRIDHQRKFLSALLKKATSVSSVINPFTSVPMALDLTNDITVDSSTHLWHIASMGLAIGGGDLVTTTVPIGSTPTISGIGSVVKWDTDKAKQFFDALRGDQAIPKDLLSS